MPTWTSQAWYVTGATASGKSAAGLALAERMNGEIIAMDSMTLFRGMDIGTDKPTAHDRARVRHHLLDLLDPAQPASLDLYLKWAGDAVEDIRGRGKQPIFVGGTPLYLKACLRGIFDGPPADEEIRRSMSRDADERGNAWLHAQLAAVDTLSAAKLAPADRRRVIRALEVYRQTGRPISDWQREFDRPASPKPRVACLMRTREDRYARIERRVEELLARGWVEEVRQLHESPAGGFGKVARQAVGYAEILDHLAGRLGYDDMVLAIKTRTRQMSKRQMTWFRHMEECVPIDVAADEPKEAIVERLASFFTSPDQDDK